MKLPENRKLDRRNLASRPRGIPPEIPLALAVLFAIWELGRGLAVPLNPPPDLAGTDLWLGMLTDLGLGLGLAAILLAFWLRNRLPVAEAARIAAMRERPTDSQQASVFFVLGVWAPLYAVAIWMPRFLPGPGGYEGGEGLATFPLLVVTTIIFAEAVRVRRRAARLIREVLAQELESRQDREH